MAWIVAITPDWYDGHQGDARPEPSELYCSKEGALTEFLSDAEKFLTRAEARQHASECKAKGENAARAKRL